MSRHGTTTASSHNRRRLVLQPPNQNHAPPDATCPLSIVIPEDHIVEILLRLPAKSLLRFRCVCKSWKSLISSSYFVNNHLHLSATDPNLRRHRLLGGDSLNSGLKLPRFLSRSLRSLLDNPSSSPPIFDESFQVRHNSLIVGSCNGLICWVEYRYMTQFLVCYFNPSTRLKSMSPYFRHPWRVETCLAVGFGYDHLRDDYKTVAIYCDPNAEKIENRTKVKVYGLYDAAGSYDRPWRKMQSFPFVPRLSGTRDQCGIFVSGTLNWLATRPDGSLVVVSVDIAKETCGEVLLPNVVDKSEIVESTKLWVLGDCLCLSYDINGVQFVLWQMKLYGVTESWTTLFNISYLDVGIDHHSLDYPRPFFMLDNNGEVLLNIKNGGVFILYNPRRKSFKYLDLEFQSDMVWFEGTTHIDSLVSPSCSIKCIHVV